MMREKTKRIAIMALFLAIQIVLVITPFGYIPLGAINVTIMHIPVIIAGIVLGKHAGAQCGFVFGLTSVINATLRPLPTSFVFSPFIEIGGVSGNYASLLVAFVPRILLGYLAGVLYTFLLKKRVGMHLRIGISAIVASFSNTLVVLLGIYCFFAKPYASAIHVELGTLFSILMGIVLSNGIIEAILAVLVCSIVVKALFPIMKHKS